MQYLERDSWGSNKPSAYEIKSTGGDAEESLQATLLQLVKKMEYRIKVMQIINESGPRILTDCDTDLLLRRSRKYRNPELFAFILKSKPKTDVQVPDLSPLITTALEEDWPAAWILHNALIDDICAQLRGYRTKRKRARGREIYMIELEEVSWSKSVIASRLASKMLDRGLKIEQVARTLHELYYALRLIVDFGNVELTKAFLACNRPSCFDDKSALEMLVRNVDVAQLEVVLDYSASLENPWDLALQLFHLMMDDMSRLNESLAGRSFARSLFQRRDLFTDEYLDYLERAIMRASRKNLEALLEYEFRSAWMSKGLDVLACAFGNRDPEVLQLLKKSKVEVDARGSFNRGPLHFAADKRAVESVRFLLSRGADSNARDEDGSRPLHCAYKLHESDPARTEECVRLLMIAGADPLLVYLNIDDHVPQFFGIYALHPQPECKRIVEYLVAELAVREAMGRSVEEPIEACRASMGKEFTDKFYEGCRRQINQLKSHRIRDKFTMFSLLAGRDNQIVRWIDEEDRDSIAAFMRSYKKDKTIMLYYYDALKYRMKMIDRMKIYIDAAKDVLSECMQLSDSDHLVIRTILSYLTLKDVLILD